MDVQMPDGTIVTGVPDDVTQSALLERYKSYQPPAGIASLTSTLPPTSNPLYGLVSRAGSLIGEGIEGVARVAEKAGDKLEGVLPLSNLTAEQIANQRQLEPLFNFAESTKNWAKGINYEPSTKLADLASNPLNAVPFIVERVISSSPDMAASVVAMPAYVAARTNEILNDRLKNDEKKLDDATVADVTAALGGAIMESTLERFATKNLFKGKPVSGKSATTRVAKEVGIQSGTEGTEEAIGYLAGTVGTKKGVDSKELGESILEGAIVGGGLGGGVRGTREYLDYRNKKQEAADAIAKEDEGVIPPVEETIKTSESSDAQAANAPPTAEVFYSEEPLPQEILDQGYTLVDQREEDGQVYYVYSKEPTVQQPLDQTPPTAPPDTEGLNDDDKALLAQVTESQPVQFTEPKTGATITLSRTKIDDPALVAGQTVAYGGKTYYTYAKIPQKDAAGQLELTPVNPEGTVLPTPAPPAAPAVAQLPLAQVNPEGTVLPTPAPRQVAAEPVATTTPPSAKRVAAEPTVRYGITDDGETGVPLTEGGKPFKTRKEAEDIKALQPQLRILPIKANGQVAGYVLADKTEKQLAAEKVAAKRLQAIPVGGLLGDMLRQGGINPVHRAELGFDKKENPIIGNRRLFAAQGKGASLSNITESQEESNVAESEYTGRDIDVQQSLPDRIKEELRRYNSGEVEATGVDALEQKLEAEFQDFLAAEQEANNATESMLDAGYTQQDLNVVGFTTASPELKAEVAALEAQMEALGLDASDIIAEISFTPNITELEYYTRAKSELTKAIAQAAKQGSGGNVSQANVSAASEGITSPTEAELKSKQAAIDKAAAEKAKADRDAAAKDKEDADRKAIAAASEKAAGEFELGKSAEDDLSGQKPTFSRSTVEQQENADLVADNFNGKVVYQNGDISLIQGRDEHNDVVYVSAKGTIFFASSIEKLKNTSALFTQAESKELLDARATLEAQDDAKHAANPFVTFKNGMATSKNVSPELKGIFKQWKSLLKLNQNIYLSTIEDALANQNDFAGPQRRIGNAAFTYNEAGTPGVTQALSDGTRYILVDQNQSPAALIEILAHEMGHAHEQEMFDNAPAELQKQIKVEFDKWLNSQKGKTAKEFIYALRAKETAETTTIPNPDMLAKDLQKYASYWSTFSEWYADQTARWATTSEKPLTAVDKFFAKVAETLRNFFKSIQGLGFLPNTTFKQYMDDITATEIVAANPITSINEQMPLFATKIALPAQPQTVPSTGSPRPNVLGAPIAGTWMAAPETTFTPFIYKYQDKQVDLKDAQKQIEKTVGKIDDALNAYRKETLYYGRVADQQEQFLNKELKPLLKEIESKKLTLDEVDKYLQALHAEERNKSIAKRINGMQDGGAGIATADAKAYLAGLSPDKAQDLQGIAKRVRNIIAGTQAVEVAGGLELQSKIDGWNKAWPNYVPLFRDEIDYVNPSSGMGQGFSTRGGSSKRAVGSDKPVKEIIASLSDQRQKAIVRSEKARVGKSLYALAIANPNPDYWLAIDPNSKSDIKKVEQMLLDYGFDQGDIAQLIQNMAQEPKTGSVKRVFNPATKQFDEVVKYEINAQNRYSSNVLAIRVNGEDKFLFFNPSNDRAKRMAEAIKNLDAEQLGEGLQTLGSVTRFIAALSTQYNPIFGAFNFARDVQGAMLNLTTTPLRYKKAEVFAGSFKALKGIYAEARARRAGGQSSSYYSDLYRDFESVGGKTGFLNQFSNFQKKGTIVERELKNLTKGRLKRAVSAVGGLLSDYNDMLENAVRLSAYEQGIKMNLSKEEAAEIAKNLTVNFNRKGAKTGWLGALYAFFNSAVQGTTRLYETLRGPAGKKIIAGGFLLGAFQAALLAMAGFDEDEPSEFIKQKNFIIPTFDGGYVMIPMPLGFNILPNVGRIISEIAFGNKKSGTRKVGDLLEAAVSSFNPLGGGNAIQVLSPTAFDPIANIILNKDSFGRPISREDRALNPTPGYLRSRESAGVISKGIAEFLNYVSGGTEFNKGAFSPTGDDINYVVSQYLGGVGREVMRAKEFATSTGKDEPFEPYKVPILGKLYGDVKAPASVASKFYLNIKQMAEHENEIKGRKGAAISEYIRENPEARLSKAANNLENQISKLNKTKREFIERNAPEDAIRRIEDQKLRMMKQFNEQVRRLQ